MLLLLKVAVVWPAEEQILARGGHGRTMNYNELIVMRRYKDAAPLSPHKVHSYIASSKVGGASENLCRATVCKRKLRLPTWEEQIRPGETRPKGVTTSSRHPTSYLVGSSLRDSEYVCSNLVRPLDPRDSQPRCGSAPSTVTLLCSNFTLLACCDNTRVLDTFLRVSKGVRR